MVEKLLHYALTNTASVYDEEALTAIELAGRTAAKVNEAVEAFNTLEDNTENALALQDEKISEQQRQMSAHYNNIVSTIIPTTVENEVDTQLKSNIEAGVYDADIISRINNDDIHKAVAGHTRLLNTPGFDMNGVIEPDNYLIQVTNAVNNPLNTTGMLTVDTFSNDRFLVQKLYPISFSTFGANNAYWVRYGSNPKCATHNTNFADGLSVEWSEWVNLNSPMVNISTPGIDINTLTKEGKYVIGVTDSVNAPTTITGGYVLEVTYVQPFVLQTATDVNKGRKYVRSGRADLGTFSEWHTLATHEDIGGVQAELKSYIDAHAGGADKPLTGKVIVNMGDSIIDFDDDGISVSSCLEAITGATCYNVGFEGARLTSHPNEDMNRFSPNYLLFSKFYNSYDACDYSITSGNVPSHFAERLTTFKSIDFSKVDIITICCGTNDYTGSGGLSDYSSSCASLVGNIQEFYPHIRIVFVGAPNRVFRNGGTGEIVGDGYTYSFSIGEPLTTYNTQMKNAIANKGVYVDTMSKQGITIYNWSTWGKDDTHPNAEGKRMLARCIASEIM